MAQTDLFNLTETEDEDTLRGKYLIFSMGDEFFGMEIRYITEIIGIQPITEVPEMPEYVKGVTNLRGKIIPVMDARLRFKKALREYDDRTCIIVVETGDVSIGLIVDSVAEVLTLQDEDIAPPPEMGKGGHKYIKGIGKAGGNVMLLLDCQRLLTDDELDAIGLVG
ncbi:MAG TPA: chemotaxis protein CheW [Bacillota bacterium]|jgi:purine-binding chemotaxis protein CheW|nr:chemotaxis protein CheW [Bacillota bacterium]